MVQERVRQARLKGMKAANRILGMLEAREKIEEWGGQIDVFGALAEFDIVVMFKPLDGLLGAFLRGDQPGALISTKRPRSVQRFTAAHELGHFVLEHEPSLDSPDVLSRAASGWMGKPDQYRANLQEIEADAFASEFLVPRWLILRHAQAQNWSLADLSVPENIYQLSLRCGASFEATVRILNGNSFINKAAADRALTHKPKDFKSSLRADAPLANSWADVVRLSELDAQSRSLKVGIDDLIAIELPQRASTGFVWRLQAPTDADVKIEHEASRLTAEPLGGKSTRVFVLSVNQPGHTDIELAEKRPWSDECLRSLTFNIDAETAESGLSRANRQRLLAA